MIDQNQLIEQLISGKLSFFDFSTLMDNSETVRRFKIIFGRKIVKQSQLIDQLIDSKFNFSIDMVQTLSSISVILN